MRHPSERRGRIIPELPPDPRAEKAVLALLGAGTLLALAFVLLYAFAGSLPDETQLLGASIGLSLLCLAAALVVTGRRLVATEELSEDYPPHQHPDEERDVAQLVAEGGGRITRRRLFKLGLIGAGGALGLALLTPAVSLGPVFRVAGYLATPWRRGRRLVDEQGRPVLASSVEEGTFYTAFAEGADLEAQSSALVLVRLPERELRLPPPLEGYEAKGIVAYSKICTHAGCAISLYRSPLFRPDEPRPALVCPCHYSTFDPATGGTVIFGPAGRPLPMLPLEIDPRGHLRARGNFDAPVGPSWWGVRIWRPTS
jgi:ubiquinol-cytochrome c reductase iron-sulfur subunit